MRCMNPGHFFIEFYFKMYAYAKFYNDTTGYKILITRLDTRDFNQWCLGIIQASFEGYDIEVLFYNQTEIIVAEKVKEKQFRRKFHVFVELWWFHFGIDRTYLNWRGG